jgi:hypothetical protein
MHSEARAAGAHVLRRTNRYRDSVEAVRVGRLGLTWSAGLMAALNWPGDTIRLAVWWIPDAGWLEIIPDPMGYRPVADHGSWKLHGPVVARWLRDQEVPVGLWPAQVVEKDILRVLMPSAAGVAAHGPPD